MFYSIYCTIFFEVLQEKIKNPYTFTCTDFSGVSDGIRTHGLQGHNLAL